MSSTWWIFLCLCPYHLLQANPRISPLTSPPLFTATAAVTHWIVPARRTQKPPKQWNKLFQKAEKIHVTQLDLRLTSRWSRSRKAELSPGQAFCHRKTASYKVFKNTATAWNCCLLQRQHEEGWYLTGIKKMQLRVTAITFKCASLKRIPVQSTGKLDFSFKNSVITETHQRLRVSCLSYSVFLKNWSCWKTTRKSYSFHTSDSCFCWTKFMQKMYMKFLGKVWNYLQNIEKYILDSAVGVNSITILEPRLSKCLGRV